MSTNKTVDIVLKQCEDLEDVLNNNLLKKFSIAHGINPTYNKLELKQEVVARKALFFSKKKRYALHIINKERKDVDEMYVRGMILRRSEYPSFTKECIAELLDMIIKPDTINLMEICDYVTQKEEEILKMIENGDKRIAKSVMCKPEEDYKKIPTHMLGAELWNNLEYDYFVPGMKGYMFKILGVDAWSAPERVSENSHLIGEKNNNIVLPFEEERLPSYYIIDIKGMFNFSWNDRVREVLEPLMDEVDNYRKSLRRDD